MDLQIIDDTHVGGKTITLGVIPSVGSPIVTEDFNFNGSSNSGEYFIFTATDAIGNTGKYRVTYGFNYSVTVEP